MATDVLKAPFPYPGGKSRVADDVWARLGNVNNYVEPFAGTLAVLLRRPVEHFANGYRVETVNDANHFLVNFWRAVAATPEDVAKFADWPVHEADLHARHKWLMRSAESQAWRKVMAADPHHYDAKIAGWWVWGQCCWIGPGWCHDDFVSRVMMPQIGSHRGEHRDASQSEARESLQIPEHTVGRGGTAARGKRLTEGRPNLADAFDIGRGVNSGGRVNSTARPDLAAGNALGGLSQQIPLISSSGDGVYAVAGWDGNCDSRRAWLTDWMRCLADRLRLVRTCYGHWSRVCDSDSTLTRHGTTGVFLDPPYPAKSVSGKKSRDASLYATDKGADLDALRDEVLMWCRKWGGDPQIRVAVCGYEGDGYEALLGEGWTETAWEAQGGYANQRRAGKGKSENAKRERIWYSPACLDTTEPNLFSCVSHAEGGDDGDG